MSWSALSALINTISSALLIVLMIPRIKELRARMFLFYLIPPALWSFSYYLWQSAQTASEALFWVKALTIFASFIPAVYLEFVCAFTGINKNHLGIKLLQWIPLSFILLINSPLFIAQISPKLNYTYWPTAGPIYSVYLITWVIGLLYALFLLLKKMRQSSGLLRTQIGIIISGTFIGYLGGATNYPLWFNIPILPYGNILVSVSILIFFYALIARQLFDFRLALARALLFTILLGLSLAFFGGLMFTLSNIFLLANPYLEFLLNLIAVLVVGFSFGPISHAIRNYTDRLFYRREYTYNTVLSELSAKLNSVVALDETLGLVMQTAASVLHLEGGSTYVYRPGIHPGETEIKMYKLERQAHNPSPETAEPILEYALAQPEILITDDLKNEIEREEMELSGLRLSRNPQPDVAGKIRSHAEKQKVLKRLLAVDAGVAIPLYLTKSNPTPRR